MLSRHTYHIDNVCWISACSRGRRVQGRLMQTPPADCPQVRQVWLLYQEHCVHLPSLSSTGRYLWNNNNQTMGAVCQCGQLTIRQGPRSSSGPIFSFRSSLSGLLCSYLRVSKIIMKTAELICCRPGLN